LRPPAQLSSVPENGVVILLPVLQHQIIEQRDYTKMHEALD